MTWEWLGGIFAPVKQWLKNRAAEKQAEHERNLAVIQNQARLAQSEKDYNHEWEMANLQDKDKGLRYFSYAMFTAPIVITVISPAHGKEIFANLENVPPWLVQTWIAINGGVWGISSLKNVVPSVIGNIRKAKAVKPV